MRFVIMSMAIAALIVSSAAQAGHKNKTKTTTCSSYTNINGTTKSTCKSR